MKFINIILSVLFLSLSCMPCADSEADSSNHTGTEVSLKKENPSHDNHIDLCTPFCVCNCCGAQVLTYLTSTAIVFPIVYKSIKTPLPTYKSLLTSNFFGSIWQPPQIV